MSMKHPDYPISIVFRVSVVQRDYLNDVASLHGITQSEYLRALLDAALTAEAKAVLGVPGADDATTLAHACEVVEAVRHA